MFKKIINKFAIRIIKKNGCSSYMACALWKAIWEDFWEFKEIPLKEKLWAYRKGFLSVALIWYPDLKNKYKDYLPNLTYYFLHPINGCFSHWIDDKLTFRYIFKDYGSFFPGYYFLLNFGNVMPLMDAPVCKNGNYSYKDVLEIIKEKGKVAIKPLAGEWGKGFCMVEFNGRQWFLNDTVRTQMDIIEFICSLKWSIVSEYIESHNNIRKISIGAPGTARLVFYNEGEKIYWLGAFMRFGTKKSGPVDNVNAGGILCGIDISNGRFFAPKASKGNRVWSITHHPDNNEPIEGYLPHWEKILPSLENMLLSCPMLKYGGLDVIVSNSGFKVIEINSFPDVDFTQFYYPFMKTPEVRKFFEEQINNLRNK